MKYIVVKLEDETLNDLESRLPGWMEIVGEFKAPTKFCQCGPGAHKDGFTRGQKYGWWVCAKCKKPTELWGTNLNALLTSARNLLATEPQTLGAAHPVQPQQ